MSIGIVWLLVFYIICIGLLGRNLIDMRREHKARRAEMDAEFNRRAEARRQESLDCLKWILDANIIMEAENIVSAAVIKIEGEEL
jgi:hypothetical protein